MDMDVLIKTVDNTVKKKKLLISRFKRFDLWLKTNDFDSLLYRIILEIKNDEYSLYGVNCKLQFIADYVEYHRNPIIVPEINKRKRLFRFKNFYFDIDKNNKLIKIYNKEDKKCLISL